MDTIRWLEQHDKLSGWAQAIGALLAIVAAFVVARLDQYAERTRHRQRQVTLVTTAMTMADNIVTQANGLISEILADLAPQAIARTSVGASQIIGGIDEIDAFPAYECESLTVGFHLRRLRVFLRQADALVGGIFDDASHEMRPTAEQLDAVSEVAGRLAEIRQAIFAAAKAYVADQRRSRPFWRFGR